MGTRNLIALYITVLLLPLTLLAYRYVGNISFDYYEVNDEIALTQLRENLLFIYDLNYDRYTLNFRYKGDNYSLLLINNKLILKPGTQIYLMDIDDLYFTDEGGFIYINYERGNKKYKRILCGTKGLYLDDFSDCPYEYDESDNSES